eukprot:m51a1_g9208 putative 3 5 -cyclic nucleotide phosphodiesterase family protein (801) ;mRNA; r:7530-10619
MGHSICPAVIAALLALARLVPAGELGVMESTVRNTASVVDQIYTSIESAVSLVALQAEQVSVHSILPDLHLADLSFLTGPNPILADLNPNRTSEFWLSTYALTTDPDPLLVGPFKQFGDPRCWCRNEWLAFCNKTEHVRAGRPCMSCERACDTLWGLRASAALDPILRPLVPRHPFTLGWLWTRGVGEEHRDWGRVWALMPYSQATGMFSYAGVGANVTPWTTKAPGGFATQMIERMSNDPFNRTPQWSQPFWLAPRNTSAIAVGSPIWSRDGEFLGGFYTDLPMSASKTFFLNLSFISPIPFRCALAYSSGEVIAASDEVIAQLWGSCPHHMCNITSLSPRMGQISGQASASTATYWDVTIRGEHYVVMLQTLKLGWKLWFFIHHDDAFPKDTSTQTTAIAVAVPVGVLSLLFMVTVVAVHRCMRKQVKELEKQLGTMATGNVIGTPAEDAIWSLLRVQKHGKLKPDLREDVTTVIALIAGNKLFKANSNLKEKLQELIVTMAAMDRHNLIAEFGLDRRQLQLFLREVEMGYKDNPYHSSFHATDVVQAMHSLLTDCREVPFTPLEKLAALIAAACHDYGHWGVNNAFLQATMNALYVQYNGISALESMHSAESMRLMLGLGSGGGGKNSTKEEGGKDQASFVRGKLTREDTYELHRSVAQLILATDMARHLELTSLFATRTTAGKMDPASKADRLLVLQMLIKASDVSNPARPWPACHRWARRVMDEFFAQGDAERALGLRVSPFMDRATADTPKCQLAFIKFVVRPMMESIQPLCPSVAQSMLENLTSNATMWEQQQ